MYFTTAQSVDVCPGGHISDGCDPRQPSSRLLGGEYYAVLLSPHSRHSLSIRVPSTACLPSGAAELLERDFITEADA